MMRLSKKKFILVLILLAIASGVIWGLPFDNPLKTDGIDFDNVAMSILENGFFYKSEFMNAMIERTFYPLFLAGVYKVFGHHLIVVCIIQIFIFAGLAVLVYKLCQRLFSERVARLASIITALCYSIASFTGYIYREIFFPTLIFLMVYFLYRAQKEKKAVWFVASGMVFGAASLTNSIIQFFIIFIIANFLFLERKNIKEILPKLAVFLLAFAIFVSPWVIGNYINYGRTPFLSKSGVLLAMRAEKMHDIQGKVIQHIIANTTGDFFAQKMFPNYDPIEARFGWDSWNEWEAMVDGGTDPREADRILNERGVKEFIKHPIMFAEMSLIDFLKFNTPMVPDVRMQHMFAVPGTYPNLPDFVKGSIILFIRFVYLVLGAFIIYAVVKYIRHWQKMSWIILIIFYFNLAFSNLHALARYSVPVYPFYIILFALGFLALWDRYIPGAKTEKKK